MALLTSSFTGSPTQMTISSIIIHSPFMINQRCAEPELHPFLSFSLGHLHFTVMYKYSLFDRSRVKITFFVQDILRITVTGQETGWLVIF